MKSRAKNITNAKAIPDGHVQSEAKAKEKPKAKTKAKGKSKSIPKYDIKASKVW